MNFHSSHLVGFELDFLRGFVPRFFFVCAVHAAHKGKGGDEHTTQGGARRLTAQSAACGQQGSERAPALQLPVAGALERALGSRRSWLARARAARAQQLGQRRPSSRAGRSFLFYILKKIKILKIYVRFEKFQKYTPVALWGRQVLNVIFSSSNLQRGP